ncbi:MAG: hypothetical protein H7039_13895, partial [Bryobacteraceae bacterium]|nr:hypothetical protein [Bryobacteraceae bacterium]
GQPGTRGTFNVVASDLPGMITQHAPNPIWFGFKDGKRALLRSFHVGDRFLASNWDDPSNPSDGEKRKQFLDWFQKQGYNTISIASHYLNRTVEARGKGWNTPDLWPLNAGEYRKMEMVLDDLQRRRIVVFPFAGFFGKEADYPRDPAEQEIYIKYTLARLGAYWNLMFLVGGPEPLFKKNPHMSFEEVNRIGTLIAQHDVFGHLLSVHNATGEDPFKDQTWLSYGVLQGPKTLDPAVLSKGLLQIRHPAKPVYAQETLWPGNTYGHPKYTATNARKNTIVAQMSAAAINYADMKGSSSTGFSGSMDPADKVQEWHDIIYGIWNYFETIPFERMKPRQDLVDNGYCLAEEGREYLIYLDRPGSVTPKLSSGSWKAEWINAQNLKQVKDGGTVLSGKPMQTPEGGDDWLLRVRKAGR